MKVSEICKIRATNYLAVHSAKEFKQRVDEDFDYLVSPSVFNINVKFDSPDWRATRVYGSPGFEIPSQGTLFQMVILFLCD